MRLALPLCCCLGACGGPAADVDLEGPVTAAHPASATVFERRPTSGLASAFSPGWHQATADSAWDDLGSLFISGNGSELRVSTTRLSGLALSPALSLAVRWPGEPLKTLVWKGDRAELPFPGDGPDRTETCSAHVQGQLFAFLDENANGQLDVGPGGEPVLASTVAPRFGRRTTSLHLQCVDSKYSVTSFASLDLRDDPLLRATVCPGFVTGTTKLCGLDLEQPRVLGATVRTQEDEDAEPIVSAEFTMTRGLGLTWAPVNAEVLVNGRAIPGGTQAWGSGLPRSRFIEGLNRVELTHRGEIIWSANLVLPPRLDLRIDTGPELLSVDVNASWAESLSIGATEPNGKALRFQQRGARAEGTFPESGELRIGVMAWTIDEPFRVYASGWKTFRL
jgi:hypothetical protein